MTQVLARLDVWNVWPRQTRAAAAARGVSHATGSERGELGQAAGRWRGNSVSDVAQAEGEFYGNQKPRGGLNNRAGVEL